MTRIINDTLNVTGAVDLDSTLNVDGASTLVGDVGTSGVFKVDDTQVVSNRVIDARCDDTINTAAWDATTAGVLDALRDAMITHGLIAAA